MDPHFSPGMEFPCGRIYGLPSATTHVTPLHLAAFYGDLDMFTKIVNCLEEKNPAERETGWTPLHYAVAGCPEDGSGNGNHLNICRLILDSISDEPGFTLPSTTCSLRTTPLHVAAGSGQLEMCQLFCERIEDKNPVDGTRKTPLQVATWGGAGKTWDFHSNIMRRSLTWRRISI